VKDKSFKLGFVPFMSCDPKSGKAGHGTMPPKGMVISMTKLLYPDFFNDVFGPIMQPGSSGGFAGPCRIGNAAGSLVGYKPKNVSFLFNREHTTVEHLATFMSDRGFLGGVQGFLTDDIRLFKAHELARESGLSYDFNYLRISNDYPRSVRIEIEGASGKTGSLTATSVGGGMIRVHEVNGFKLDWAADTYGVLLYSCAGDADFLPEAFLKAYAQPLLSAVPAETEDGRQGYFIELSEKPEETALKRYFPALDLIVLPALLPVITTKERCPQLFKTVGEWRQVAKDRGISFAQAAIEYEKAFSGWSDGQIWARFGEIADILHHQIHALEEIGYENAVDTPQLPIYGRPWNTYIKKNHQISDSLTTHILIHAFSTNAKLPGVRIVPGPMGTGGGYLFSALDAVREARGISREKLLESLAVAAALGALAYTHTNASGEVGCVGESGVCCAMAAGAVTWLVGGDGIQVERAASMALQANIGIPCDPIPGGLEFPCITRTLRAAVTASLYADLALSGIDPLISYHEMLQAIEANFKKTPQTDLCGSACGCNRTPTARACMENLRTEISGTLHYVHL
jgi:L-serine dehydratase